MATTNNDVRAELEALKLENEALKAKMNKPITCKIGTKGGLCIYGLGRYPVSLYLSQVRKLDEAWPDVMAFVEKHISEFAVKE